MLPVVDALMPRPVFDFELDNFTLAVWDFQLLEIGVGKADERLSLRHCLFFLRRRMPASRARVAAAWLDYEAV